VPLQQGCLKVCVPIAGRVEQQSPLFAGSVLAEMPEDACHRSDDLSIASQPGADDVLGEVYRRVACLGCGSHLEIVRHAERA
jgi:hypothetical protein